MLFARGSIFSAALLLACAAGSTTAQVMDDLNGVWTVTLDGSPSGLAMTESYHGIRIRLLPDGQPVDLVRSGDVLTSKGTGTTGITGGLSGEGNANAGEPDVELTIAGLDTPTKGDDRLTGTWFGKPAVLARDLTARPPIEIDMSKGDRPWVRFMREVLIPKSAEDRETWHRFDKQAGGEWIKTTELGRKRYWINKGWFKDQAAMDRVIAEYHGTLNSPRSVLSTRLSSLVRDNMRADKAGEIGLALSQLGMYFSTASGGALRLIVTKNRDSIVYYITDKRAHARTGLVVNATPTHRPLASSFGKWQNDAGDMTLADDEPYDRAVLELMVRSNTSSMNDVSGTGRGAFTDYFGIMAIEDQRGVMFGDDWLDWGRNMTQASFGISVIRALGHGEMRQKPAYRATPETEIADEPLVSLRARASGLLEPRRGLTPKSIRIEAPGLPAVLDDGEGSLYAEGTDPSEESVGWVEYEDGSYSLDWGAFVSQAKVTFKDAGQNQKTRPLARLTTTVSGELGEGKVEPRSIRIQAAGFPAMIDDGEGTLYLEGTDPSDDYLGWIDYEDGSFDCSWNGAAAEPSASFRTTDGEERTQALKPTCSSDGLFDPLDVKPGSVRITAGEGPAIVDDGKGLLHDEGAPDQLRGRVSYDSGSFSIRWNGVPAQPLAASFQDASGQTKTFPLQLTVSAGGTFARTKVTPRSIRIRAGGLKDIVDDGEGTLYEEGSDPSEGDRGYISYESASFSVTWTGAPADGKATVSYRSKAGEIVLTSEKELAMQVIVDDGDGPTLCPGSPSYIDCTNGAENALEGGWEGGGDCQVYALSTMEELTTAWLRAKHAAVIDRLENALAPFAYEKGTDNLFASMTWTFYDAANFSKVTPAQGDEIIEAGLQVFRTIRKDSRGLEAFMLENGVTKSDRWAPRASGF